MADGVLSRGRRDVLYIVAIASHRVAHSTSLNIARRTDHGGDDTLHMQLLLTFSRRPPSSRSLVSRHSLTYLLTVGWSADRQCNYDTTSCELTDDRGSVCMWPYLPWTTRALISARAFVAAGCCNSAMQTELLYSFGNVY